MDLFKNLFGDKPWYESVTAWALLFLGAAEIAVQVGLVPAGAIALVVRLGELAVALGIRKAATSKNVT